MSASLNPGQSLAGIRVLLVDDHQDSRDIFQQVLEYEGAVVAASPSADEALHHLDEVDVVVTDIAMPGHDGFWLLREVQESATSVPVIAVSGYSELAEKALREAAFTKVLRKPIDPWVLCRAVATVVRPSA